jgi:twitching motility protein PilT
VTTSTEQGQWGRRAADYPEAAVGADEVRRLLEACVSHHASDLHIRPGNPPVLRINGHLERLPEAPFDAAAAAAICRALCSEAQWASLREAGTVDLALTYGNGERFRVSVMRERAGYAASLRRITARLLTFEEIGIDRTTVTGLLRQTRGLILVTGPTGSGKSTTLAAMVDWINEHLDRHIVTIEDPVEYLHRSRRSLVTQREVGSDVPSFAEAMRRVLRQDPDVIMVGEMRDLETIATATTAAETGHLVLGTLHTTGSAKTVSRIIDVFPPNQQEQIRVQLAMSLLAVISQVLIPVREGATDREGHPLPARVAALEVMTTTAAISNLIRNNEIVRMQDVIQTSRDRGMFTLDDHLALLVKRGVVEREVALAFCLDTRLLESRLR